MLSLQASILLLTRTSRMLNIFIDYVLVSFISLSIMGLMNQNLRKKTLDAAKYYKPGYHKCNLLHLSELQRHWVEVCGQSSWARHSYDPSARCPQMITELKCLPICQFVMGFEAKLIQLFLTRRRNGRLWKDERIVPRASAKLGDQILHKSLYHASSRPVWRSNHKTLVMNICNRTSRNVHLLLRTYVHEYFTVRRYMASYAGIIKGYPSMTESL
ncbi:hypothetical protein MKW98_006861 [Papaver atlanticum]|uniref:Uncharacterized protein n=1 Tax=Papaver atlanticum TaxID=357466 RepID=A0AAD4SSV4_9MAGN|nr:hypothetical protein MKW98_006861 [Papaver atlanticum]